MSCPLKCILADLMYTLAEYFNSSSSKSISLEYYYASYTLVES